MRTKEQRLSPLSAGKGTKKIINIRLPTPKIMLKGAMGSGTIVSLVINCCFLTAFFKKIVV